MSLKIKFSLIIFFVVFTLLTIVCSVLAYRSISGLEEDLRDKDSLISENLLPKLLDDLGDYYVFNYGNYVNSVKKHLEHHPDLVYFRIINTQNEMIFETAEIREGKKAGNPPQRLADPLIQEVIKTRRSHQDIITINDERYIRIIAPYVDNFGAFRNLAEFRFSLKEIEDTIRETIIFFVIFLVSFTIIGIGIASFFVEIITKPLSKLTSIAAKITTGDLSQQVTITSNDEVGTLGKAFNHMVENLKQKIGQLHREQIKLEASINSLSVGFIMVNSNHEIEIINRTAKIIFCSPPSAPLTLVNECSLAHIENELKNSVDLKSFIATCFTTKKTVTIKEIKYQQRDYKVLITPIVTIGVIGAVILLDDITEAKILERSKEEFFSIASHELRTPLTAIRGNTSMIQQFYGEKIKDPELGEMINDINESSVRLIEIVNDFLDTSRLEMGKMEFKKEAFDILKLTQDTTKEYMTTGSMKKLSLQVTPPAKPLPPVAADQNKIKQVLINLIGNAIKFTDVGGITLTLTQEGNMVKVAVIDTGRGISADSQKLLFRKFQQAQDNILTRDYTRGTGLGLYISRLIMEGMGGTIKIDSSIIGKGTTFSISIPIATQAAPQPASQPIQQTQQPNQQASTPPNQKV